MFKKKTSKTRYNRQRADRMLHLQVSSPRIVFFQSLRTMRGFLKYAVLIALLGFGVTMGVRAVKKHFVNNEEFVLRDIDLQTNGFLTHGRVVEIGEIDVNGTIFAVDIDELEKRLLDQPGVTSAKVERKLPGTLKVEVTERVPVAWVACRKLGLAGRNPHSGMLVDADGVVFTCEGRLWDVARNLPVIEIEEGAREQFIVGREMAHDDAERALSLVCKIQGELGEASDWRVKRVRVKNFYTLEVTCSDDVNAVFGMYEHERQLGDFLDARRHAVSTGRELAWINLLPKHNIPGRFKD